MTAIPPHPTYLPTVIRHEQSETTAHQLLALVTIGICYSIFVVIEMNKGELLAAFLNASGAVMFFGVGVWVKTTGRSVTKWVHFLATFFVLGHIAALSIYVYDSTVALWLVASPVFIVATNRTAAGLVWSAIACVLMCILASHTGPLSIHSQEMHLVRVHLVLSFLYCLMGCFVLDWSRRKANLRLASAMEQIQQLKGLLVTCSFCHAIKTPDQKWIRFEAYLQRCASVNFSHGLCPDCYEENYSEYDTPGMADANTNRESEN